MARPLARAFSSPLVTLSPQGSPQEPINISKQVTNYFYKQREFQVFAFPLSDT